MRGEILRHQGEADASRRNLAERVSLAARLHGQCSRAAVQTEVELAGVLTGDEQASEAWRSAVEHSRRASGGWGEEHANLLDRARLYFASRDPVLAGRLAEEERKARPSTRVRTGYRY
jgi:hypothetical protein